MKLFFSHLIVKIVKNKSFETLKSNLFAVAVSDMWWMTSSLIKSLRGGDRSDEL